MPNTFVAIATVTVGSGGASSIDFTSIPSTYTDLCLKMSLRTNRSNVLDGVSMYYNGDTTFTRYTAKELIGDGSGAVVASWAQGNDEFVYVSANSATGSTFGSTEIYIPNYAGSNEKSASAESASETNGTTARMNFATGRYNQTTAISSITLKPVNGTSFQQYSSAYLYGIKKS